MVFLGQVARIRKVDSGVVPCPFGVTRRMRRESRGLTGSVDGMSWYMSVQHVLCWLRLRCAMRNDPVTVQVDRAESRDVLTILDYYFSFFKRGLPVNVWSVTDRRRCGSISEIGGLQKRELGVAGSRVLVKGKRNLGGGEQVIYPSLCVYTGKPLENPWT